MQKKNQNFSILTLVVTPEKKIGTTPPPKVVPEVKPENVFFGTPQEVTLEKHFFGTPLPSQISGTSGAKNLNYRYPPPSQISGTSGGNILNYRDPSCEQTN